MNEADWGQFIKSSSIAVSRLHLAFQDTTVPSSYCLEMTAPEEAELSGFEGATWNSGNPVECVWLKQHRVLCHKFAARCLGDRQSRHQPVFSPAMKLFVFGLVGQDCSAVAEVVEDSWEVECLADERFVGHEAGEAVSVW